MKDKEVYFQEKRRLRDKEKITTKRIRIANTINSYLQKSVNSG